MVPGLGTFADRGNIRTRPLKRPNYGGHGGHGGWQETEQQKRETRRTRGSHDGHDGPLSRLSFVSVVRPLVSVVFHAFVELQPHAEARSRGGCPNDRVSSVSSVFSVVQSLARNSAVSAAAVLPARRVRR